MNTQDIDQLINDNLNYQNKQDNEEDTININDYDLLLFSDGAYERVKKRSAFGIYVYNNIETSQFNKFNDIKIIKKIDKDLLFYNKNTFDITFYNYITPNTDIVKCNNEDCKYYAIYNNQNDFTGKYCKNHKLDNMDLVVNYFSYDATNIRAEGLGILYSLIFIKSIVLDNLENKKDILKNMKIDFINNIHESFKIITRFDINSYNFKFLIVTDSEFWINVITKWSNSWIRKKTYIDKKNLDIILYINYYLYILNSNNILIKFKFIRGHSDKKNTIDKLNLFQKGNIMADKLANIGKENKDLNIKIC